MSALDATSAPKAAPSPLRWPLLRFWRLLDAPLQAVAGGDLSWRHQCFFLRLEHALAVAQYVRQASALGRPVSRRNLEAFYLDENLTARYPFPAERLSIGSIQENGQRLAKGLRAILGSDLPQLESAHQGLRRAEALSAEEWVQTLEHSLAQARPSFEAVSNPSVLIQWLVNEARECGVPNRPSLFQRISDGSLRGGAWWSEWIRESLASLRAVRSRSSPAVPFQSVIWTITMIVLAGFIWWSWLHLHFLPSRSPTTAPFVMLAPASPPPQTDSLTGRTNPPPSAGSGASPAPVVQAGPKPSEGARQAAVSGPSQIEGADLEKKFTNIADVREQLLKLKAEAAIARRLEWMRHTIESNFLSNTNAAAPLANPDAAKPTEETGRTNVGSKPLVPEQARKADEAAKVNEARKAEEARKSVEAEAARLAEQRRLAEERVKADAAARAIPQAAAGAPQTIPGPLAAAAPVVQAGAPAARPAASTNAPAPPPQGLRSSNFSAHWNANGGSAILSLSNGKTSVDIVFVSMPGGTYERGNGAEDAPKLNATLEPFFLSQDEISEAAWRLVFPNSPPPAGEDAAHNPKEGISWSEGQAFCQAIQNAGGALARVRLPLEVEWEYAARQEFAADKPQRRFRGLIDGLAEWMQDVYFENAYYSYANNKLCPGGGSSDPAAEHVVRGGASFSGSSIVTGRLRANDQRSSKGRGIRLVVVPK